MGIENFLKIYISKGRNMQDLATMHDQNFLQDKKILIDASVMIYRSRFAIKNNMTSGDKVTSHILVALNMINKFAQLNIGQLWVFDGGHEELKVETVEKRKQSSNNRLTHSETEDIKKLLNLIGIPYIVSDVQAEFYCVELCRQTSQYEFVYTSDTDVIMRGGIMVKDVSVDGKRKYMCLKTEDILRELNITQEDLVKIGVIMGCDFAPKTKGIGPAKILSSYKNTILTERQELAYQKLIAPIDIKSATKEFSKGARDLVELKIWLRSLDFSEETLKRIH